MKNLFLLLAVLLTISFSSCIMNFSSIDGNGKIITQTKNINNFNSIDARGAFDVVLKPSDVESVSIEADENLMDYIIVEVKSGELVIDSRENLDPSRDIVVTVYYKDLDLIELSGACELKSGQELTFDKLRIDCDGATECDLILNVDDCKFEISGATELNLSGKARKVHFDGSGAIDIDAYDLEIEDCKIELSGAADAEIFSSKTLELDISGAASLKYKGKASIVRQNISGAASITPKS